MANESGNTIAIIGVVLSLFSLVVAAISAVIARRSANAAETSAREAHAVDVRGLIRDIVGTAQGVLAERQRLEAISSRLVNGYQSLFTLGGRSKGERVAGYIAKIEKKKGEVPDMSEEASRLVENPSLLRCSSSEDLAASLAKLHGSVVRLAALRQEFESELASVEEQIRPLREKTLGR